MKLKEDQLDNTNSKGVVVEKKDRKPLFSVLLILGGCFNLIAALVFLASIILAINLAVSDDSEYYAEGNYLVKTLYFAFISFALYAICFISIIMMWKRKLLGLWIYSVAVILLLVMHFVIGQESWPVIGAGILLLLLFIINKSQLLNSTI